MMDTKQFQVLVVEDEEVSRRMILKTLNEDNRYGTHAAENGKAAWEVLQKNPEGFDVILLDRVMPEMDGIELLEHLKGDQKLSNIPVIMLTGKDEESDIVEGLEAGAYYYALKPFKPRMLRTIVASAIDDHQRYKAVIDELRRIQRTCVSMVASSHFHFRTLREAEILASHLAMAYPDPEKAVIGLQELFFNAVEHGNLGISYERKSELCEEERWGDEVERLLNLPENAEKRVVVRYEKDVDSIRVRVTDMGNGFDWERYLDFDPARAFDAHGRGIAMANNISFNQIEYIGKGNEVEATVRVG